MLLLPGLPDALHSSVIVPPFRAVNCPVCGTALTLGGTIGKQKHDCSFSGHLNYHLVYKCRRNITINIICCDVGCSCMYICAYSLFVTNMFNII